MMLKYVFIVLSGILLAGCAYKHQPIYNVDHVMPSQAQRLSSAQIEDAIIQAGQSRSWKFERLETGHLAATQTAPKFSATVDIYYDQQSWRIVHRSSVGFGEENGTIHSHYNVWVRNLEKDIDTRLNNLALMVR